MKEIMEDFKYSILTRESIASDANIVNLRKKVRKVLAGINQRRATAKL